MMIRTRVETRNDLRSVSFRYVGFIRIRLRINLHSENIRFRECSKMSRRTMRIS